LIVNPESHADDLIRIGALNIDDLETNRAGYLSERQKRNLSLNIILWLGIAAVDICILIGLIYLQILTQMNYTITTIGIILLILAYTCIKEAEPFWKDIKNKEVKSVAGKIHKNFHVTNGNSRGSRVAFCSIRVGDEVLSVSPAIYDHMMDENTYRVFFTRITRKTINIEPL
jgi:hypothetical protein